MLQIRKRTKKSSQDMGAQKRREKVLQKCSGFVWQVLVVAGGATGVTSVRSWL